MDKISKLFGSNAEASWDPTVPVAINIARLISANQTIMPVELPYEKTHGESGQKACATGLEGTIDHRLSDQKIVDSSLTVPVEEKPKNIWNNRELAEKKNMCRRGELET